jgi:hypothetical protein
MVDSCTTDQVEARESWMMSRLVMVAFLAGLFAAAGMSRAQAQQPISAGQPAANASGWTFDITPYVWFATTNTTMNLNLPPALGGTVSTDSSIGFGELVPHLHFAVMGTADAQYGRFSLLTDIMYLSLGGTGSRITSVNFPNHPRIPISGAAQASAGMNLQAVVWTLAGGYTVVTGDWGNFDVIAGFRYLSVNARINYSLALTITGPRGNGATFGGIGSVSGNAGIWNGIGGFRGRIRISNTALFIPYYFDIGGGGSNLTWQISSGLGYHLPLGDVSVTYRYLTFDQGNSAIVQKLSIRGPMLALNLAF